MNFENILFIDIETVSQYKNYEDMPEDYKYVWNKSMSEMNTSTR